MATKKNFFDFSYAQEIWKNIKTEEQFDSAWAKIDAPYSVWKKKFQKNQSKALKELETDPNALLIKQGHDLEVAYYQWLKGYDNYRKGGAKFPWNYEGHGFYCGAMIAINIFTKSCSDFPDWRTANDKARDEANVAKNFSAYKAKIDYIMGNSN